MHYRHSFIRSLTTITCYLGLASCGSTQEANAPAPPTLNWAKGAPQAEPSYSDQDLARLELCPLISTAVFVAGQSKQKGISLTETEQELAKTSSGNEQLSQLTSMFVKQTYETPFDDLLDYVQQNHTTCVEQLGELTGPRAERAVFCLNRHLVVLAAYRMRGEGTLEAVSNKLEKVPGFGSEFAESGYAGQGPTQEAWYECVKD